MRLVKHWLALGVMVALVGVGVTSVSLAEPKEAAPGAPADDGNWTSSPARVGTAPEITLLETTYETTFAEMDKVGGEIDGLLQAVKEGGIDADGYIIFVYKGVQQDMTKPFKLTIGIPVPKDTKPTGKFEVTTLPAFKNVSTLYNGSLTNLPSAYKKHYGEVVGGGHMPTDEARELYLYWEGPQSNNNVVWIQAGVQ